MDFLIQSQPGLESELLDSQRNLSQKNKKQEGWRDGVVLRALASLAEDLSWVPSTHMAAHSHL